MTTIIGRIFNSSNESKPIQSIFSRTANESEMLRQVLDNASAKIRVQMPAQVVSFDANKQTIVAQPLVREKIIDRYNGEIQWIQLPQLVDVPVCFPQGGNFVMTMPVQAGDEVVLSFTDTNIDSWWHSGGVQNWNDRRRHDLSDAIALIGVNSTPNVISDILSDGTELRSKDNNSSVTVKQDRIIFRVGEFEVVMTENGFEAGDGSLGISIGGGEVNINGTLVINGHQYLSHRHAGVQAGASLTSTVTP